MVDCDGERERERKREREKGISLRIVLLESEGLIYKERIITSFWFVLIE